MFFSSSCIAFTLVSCSWVMAWLLCAYCWSLPAGSLCTTGMTCCWMACCTVIRCRCCARACTRNSYITNHASTKLGQFTNSEAISAGQLMMSLGLTGGVLSLQGGSLGTIMVWCVKPYIVCCVLTKLQERLQLSNAKYQIPKYSAKFMFKSAIVTSIQWQTK